MVALAFRWFGTSAVVLRATAAAVGVAGVAAVWLATRRFGRWPAIVAMAWAAGSLWLVAVSRDGFRTILVVPVAALALATMLRWGDHTERRWALASGATAALGLWTYQPLKLSPVLVLLWLLWVRHADRERYRRLRAGIRWAVLAYLVVAAPMIWTAITDFNNYFGRGASVIALNPDSSSPDSYPVHVLRTLGMFFVAGDPNARHNVDGLPLLGPLLCLPFALGLWRAWRLRADHGHAALLLGLGVFLVPPLLANEGAAPHFLRILGMAPYLAALIGIGCLEAVRLLRPLGGRTSVWAVGVAASGMLIALGAVSTLTYLDRPVSARYAPYSFADVELAAAADRGPGTVAIIDDYHALVVRFLDYGRLPTIVAPGSRLAHPAVYSLIVARSQSAIARATDRRTAARAGVAARDPTGTPVVWVVVP